MSCSAKQSMPRRIQILCVNFPRQYKTNGSDPLLMTKTTDVIQQTQNSMNHTPRVHTTSPPSLPDLPQTSPASSAAFSETTNTHYIVAPVEYHPPPYTPSSPVTRRRLSLMFFRGASQSSFKTVNLFNSPKKSDETTPHPDDAEKECCCQCCGIAR
jgi:hypothetical protein